MANSVMDHVSDVTGEELVRLSRQYEFPDFVKKADMVMTRQPGRLATSTYGDPRQQLYPCHNAASTFLSALFFAEKRAEFDPKSQRQIQHRIDGFADYFGISGAVAKMREQWESLHKTADERRPDSDYGYVWTTPDGKKERRLPLTTRMEIKAAAEYLLQHRDRLPFQARHAVAKRVLEKVATYGVGLGDELKDFVQRQAGCGVCDIHEVASVVRNRGHLVKSAMLQEQFSKMADTILDGNKFQLTPSNLIKLAETLDELDRRNGLVGRYSDALPRPEDVIFKVTYDKAAADVAAHVALTNGHVYEKQGLARLSLTDVEGLFGSEFASRVKTPAGKVDAEKMAEESATLPRGDADQLGQLLNDVGVAPTLTKAASAGVGLSQGQWEKLAEAYRPPLAGAAR